VLAALVLCSCSNQPGPQQEPQSGNARPAVAAAPDRLRPALAALLRGERTLNLATIEVECRRGGRLRAVIIFGRGVGIWQRERQIELGPAEVRGLLEAVDKAGFTAMRESYGGPKDPVGDAGSNPQGLRVTCSVALEIDEVSKRVAQLAGGRQFQPLVDLASRILGVAERAVPSGRLAASLSDGLDRLASGQLAPETLTLQVHRVADPGGWLLRIRGAVATVEDESAGATGQTRALRLAPDDVRTLSAGLRRSGVSALPANVYAPGYTDLTVGVLQHTVTTQARAFAEPRTVRDRASRQALAQVLKVVEPVAERVRRAGQTRPE
jgi:hypothetical protein